MYTLRRGGPSREVRLGHNVRPPPYFNAQMRRHATRASLYLRIAGMVLSITFSRLNLLPEMRLMALRALALEKGLEQDDVDAGRRRTTWMDSGEPKAALIRLLQTARPS